MRAYHAPVADLLLPLFVLAEHVRDKGALRQHLCPPLGPVIVVPVLLRPLLQLSDCVLPEGRHHKRLNVLEVLSGAVVFRPLGYGVPALSHDVNGLNPPATTGPLSEPMAGLVRVNHCGDYFH